MQGEAPPLLDQVVVVTGAASGIGRGVALAAAARGARVVAVDLSQAGLAETAARAQPSRVEWMMQDVSEVEQLSGLFESIAGRMGRLDHLVAAAGVVRVDPFLEVTPAAWDAVFGVNVRGLFFSIQAAASVMARFGGGSIVALASVAGRLGRAQYAHYAASKAAVISLTRSAALALAPSIRVNCVCPGVIETPMWEGIDRASAEIFDRASGQTFAEAYSAAPIPRPGSPREVADLILFLMSNQAAFITGQAVHVDGGLYMA